MILNGSLTPVYCDQTSDSGGWLVIQRNDATGKFEKTWNEVKVGFGDVDKGSYWFGNENMHNLTWNSTQSWELLVHFTPQGGTRGFAKYGGFKVN